MATITLADFFEKTDDTDQNNVVFVDVEGRYVDVVDVLTW